jgi:hypothetical protein
MALLLGGCASASPPTERLVASRAAIRAAEEVGAASVPKAALQLQLAREEMAAAERLMANGEHERASGVLMRAQADAELALALAREEPLRAQAEQTTARVQELRQRMGM